MIDFLRHLMLDHYARFYPIFCLSVWKCSTCCCGFFLKPDQFIFHSTKNHSISVQPWLKRQHCKREETFSKDLELWHDRWFPEKVTALPCHSVLVVFISLKCLVFNTIVEATLKAKLEHCFVVGKSGVFLFGKEHPQRFICIRELHLPPYTEALSFCLCGTWKAGQWWKSLGNDQKLGNGEKWWKVGQWSKKVSNYAKAWQKNQQKKTK